MVHLVAGSPQRGVVAADTNAIHDYFADQTGPKFHLVKEAFDQDVLLLPPAVLTEALSDPALPAVKAARIRAVPLLAVMEGFWDRAGMLRAFLLSRGYNGRLGDVLIAQACIDHEVPLITYDRDFRRFERAGLKLL
jgi:predicted nucleic acid-binding protein